MTSSSSDVVQLVKPSALATILFCDMRGYAQFGSGATPLQLIESLNSNFSVVVDTLKENHGTAAKFVGDAVFAYWLSEEQPNHAALACRFAASLPERLSVVSSGVTTSIGIHTGNVAFVRFTSGNNRSPEPMGDAVNLASRLCGFCFHYKAKAVASEAVMTSAGGGQGWTLLDSATIKGRNEPVTLYGIL